MILVINTSGGDIEFVLGSHHARIASAKQSVDIAPQCEKFMQSASVKWSDLRAIAVVVGPGSFTGIRLGIAYAKGLAIGLNIPVIPINAFELYHADTPDAFVAIDSGRGDFFVSAPDLEPCIMTIDDVETRQMAWPRTVGHKPFNLDNATKIAAKKIESGNIPPVVPMYLRPSYAEQPNGNKK